MQRGLAVFLAMAALVGLAPSETRAQAPRSAFNSVYLELGGNALLYSVNYERITPQDVALRAGFGYLSVESTGGGGSASASMLTIPITASYLGIGGGSAKLELGGGVSLFKLSGSTTTGFGDDLEADAFVPIATFTAGFRLSPPGGGFNFKVGWTPFYHPDIGFFNWGGVALGAGF